MRFIRDVETFRADYLLASPMQKIHTLDNFDVFKILRIREKYILRVHVNAIPGNEPHI